MGILGKVGKIHLIGLCCQTKNWKKFILILFFMYSTALCCGKNSKISLERNETILMKKFEKLFQDRNESML